MMIGTRDQGVGASGVAVEFYDDARQVLAAAEGVLAADPIRNNVMLTLLHARAAVPMPGRYWVASQGGAARGVVFQSPLEFSAMVSPMGAEAVGALVEAIAGSGVELPGIGGDVMTAAAFAGEWTERTRGGGQPYQGQRVYEVVAVADDVERARGQLRPLATTHRDLAMGWLREFGAEIHETVDPEHLVRHRAFWLWIDGEARSIASATSPVQGVVRIGFVYTPPAQRRLGYAEACVAALSAQVLAAGHRCILYTDLANSTSNSVYRRIGYRAVAEGLRYRFSYPRG